MAEKLIGSLGGETVTVSVASELTLASQEEGASAAYIAATAITTRTVAAVMIE